MPPVTRAAAAPRVPARSVVALALAAVVLVLGAARQCDFVHRYAVDVMYADPWDLYNPLFHDLGWWATFDQQNGPHRQGLGGMLIRLMAPHTRWDTRYDDAAVGWILVAAAPLGVLLAWRCGVRGWPLIAVPAIYLNARQYEMLIAAANPSHGALPLLLLTLCGLAWFIRSDVGRLATVTGLVFLLTFTGFGLFGGILIPPLLLLESAQAWRAGDRRRSRAAAVALVAAVAVLVLFAVGYRFDPASDRFRFPYERPVEYLWFVGGLFGNYVGMPADAAGPGWGSVAVGLAVAAAGATVCVVRGWRVLRSGVTADRAGVAVFYLAAFGVLFAVDAAIGRTPNGWRQLSVAPRYVTLCVPTGLAILIHLATAARPWVRGSAVVYSGLLAAGTAVLHPYDLTNARWIHDGCLRWRAAYLQTHDAAAADRESRFSLFPRDIRWRLDYLEARHLNLFDPAAFRAEP